GLAACRRRTDHFSADLIELPVAALLRTLASKLRADVVKLVQAPVPKLVLYVRAYHARGILGTQRQRLSLLTCRARAILPRVHFLGDDVGLFPDPAREQRRLFENG